MRMILLVLVLLHVGTAQAQTAARTILDETGRAPLVQTLVVGVDAEILELPGRVQATRRSELAFPVSGLLSERPVVAGQRVATGELLAQLDPRDLKNRVALEEARLALAKADFLRFSRLAESPVSPVTPAEVDRKRAEFEIATLRTAQARKILEDATLTAPFDGIVAATLIENHQRVRADQPVLLLEASDALEVVVDLPERVLGRLSELPRDRPVAEAVFTAAPDRAFPARVSEIATRADAVTQSFRVTLAIDRPEDINLLPGMTATVYARPNVYLRPVLRVPLSAVGETEAGDAFVWVVDPETYAIERQPVTLGEASHGTVVVLEGLHGGQRIVSAGVGRLQAGMVISPYRTGMLSQ
ncbi:efflux RND transporter periplasmic adaptor subunit [Ectothiorhodospira lacustris]|uniref:efflux RND transporter periplasmic adaptor subunit n=1 Tax=Ectothiorhodospira lacustris TaxID=2899127 RepID=UPI001EE8F89D|nr:efflux RND transporter periplasmic adaptor subunit [Ectothiorhodospira lacustris]MCG5510220.1 efflux RND transporter periplasmic adaptor subunit [Ectothiorhodospira lacustris]MCG5521913.1 efflux RND transporter periplasmic adaptor subunit [Ectothiorhodospira lacustris]